MGIGVYHCEILGVKKKDTSVNEYCICVDLPFLKQKNDQSNRKIKYPFDIYTIQLPLCILFYFFDLYSTSYKYSPVSFY